MDPICSQCQTEHLERQPCEAPAAQTWWMQYLVDRKQFFKTEQKHFFERVLNALCRVDDES